MRGGWIISQSRAPRPHPPEVQRLQRCVLREGVGDEDRTLVPNPAVRNTEVPQRMKIVQELN